MIALEKRPADILLDIISRCLDQQRISDNRLLQQIPGQQFGKPVRLVNGDRPIDHKKDTYMHGVTAAATSEPHKSRNYTPAGKRREAELATQEKQEMSSGEPPISAESVTAQPNS